MSHWLRVHSKVEARLLHRCRCIHAGQAMQNLCLSLSPFCRSIRCCATAHTWTRMPTRLISISKLCIRRTTFPTRSTLATDFPKPRIKTRPFFYSPTNCKEKETRTTFLPFTLLFWIIDKFSRIKRDIYVYIYIYIYSTGIVKIKFVTGRKCVYFGQTAFSSPFTGYTAASIG